jgi:ATP-dependent Lon protease
MKNNGLKKTELTVAESALRDIVRYYTREAGVRSLERDISKICRKVVKTLLLKKNQKQDRRQCAQPRQIPRRSSLQLWRRRT